MSFNICDRFPIKNYVDDKLKEYDGRTLACQLKTRHSPTTDDYNSVDKTSFVDGVIIIHRNYRQFQFLQLFYFLSWIFHVQDTLFPAS